MSYKIFANESCSYMTHNSRQADIAVKLLLTILLLLLILVVVAVVVVVLVVVVVVVVVVNTTQPNFRQEQRDFCPIKSFHTVSQSTVSKMAMT